MITTTMVRIWSSAAMAYSPHPKPTRNVRRLATVRSASSQLSPGARSARSVQVPATGSRSNAAERPPAGMVARALPLASTLARGLALVTEDTFSVEETWRSPSGTVSAIARSADEQAATPPYSLAGGATTTSAAVVVHGNSRLAFRVNRVSRSTMNCCDPAGVLDPMSVTAGSEPIVTSPTAAHVTVTASPAHAVRGLALNDSIEAQPTHSTSAGTMLRTAANNWVRIRLTPLRAPGYSSRKGRPLRAGYQQSEFRSICGRLRFDLSGALCQDRRELDAPILARPRPRLPPSGGHTRTQTTDLLGRFIMIHGRFAAIAAAALLCAGPALAQDKLPPLRTGVDGTFAPHAMPKIGGGAEHGFTVQVYDTQPDATQAVLSGRAYATLGGNTTIVYAAPKNPQFVADLELKDTRAHWAAPVPKNNPKLRAELQDALDCMKKDGTIARLSEKWFGRKPAPDALEVVITPGYGPPGMPGYDPTPHELHCH